MGSIELQGVEKWFGPLQVIKGVNLSITEGEFVVFVGPSGCGKSTLLRMIAGLEEASRGKILIDGEDIKAEPPSKRGLAMVFQSYALYPHMDVRENMGFSLKTAGRTRAEIAEKVDEAARTLRLAEFMHRRPKELSGGQRQRVAIGRSIVRDPTAFLFDEPLSNLDASLRVEMRYEIAKLHQVLMATMIYVTHDQVEAMTLADRIVVLQGGMIEQVGPPRTLYEAPSNLFVAQFIGSSKMNVFPCALQDGQLVFEGGRPSPYRAPGSPAHVGVRSEAIGSVCRKTPFLEFEPASAVKFDPDLTGGFRVKWTWSATFGGKRRAGGDFGAHIGDFRKYRAWRAAGSPVRAALAGFPGDVRQLFVAGT